MHLARVLVGKRPAHQGDRSHLGPVTGYIGDMGRPARCLICRSPIVDQVDAVLRDSGLAAARAQFPQFTRSVHQRHAKHAAERAAERAAVRRREAEEAQRAADARRLDDEALLDQLMRDGRMSQDRALRLLDQLRPERGVNGQLGLNGHLDLDEQRRRAEVERANDKRDERDRVDLLLHRGRSDGLIDRHRNHWFKRSWE